MSIAVWPPNSGPSSWLELLTRIAGRIARGDHSLQFIDEVFAELANMLGLEVYLYFQSDKDEHTLTLLNAEACTNGADDPGTAAAIAALVVTNDPNYAP